MMHTELPRAGVLVCLLSSTALATVSARQSAFDGADYGNLVADYMEGSYQRAALALAQMPTRDLEAAVESYRKRPIDESHVKAALLLHTEVVMSTHRNVRFHVGCAREWMSVLDARRRRAFEKTWFLALGYFYMRTLDFETRPTLEAAANVFPDDVDVLLALGTWKETAGWMKRDDRMLAEARGIYRDILKKEPQMPEATVRMGRVLQLLGRDEEALRYLERGLDTNPEPALRFAALLTTGDIHRKRGESTQAIERYRDAMDLDPASQAAVVALSHALHESGDTRGSYELVLAFFVEKSTTPGRSSARERHENDLWWRYSLGGSQRSNTLLRGLREEIQE